jgi:hypothetical protein
MSYGYFIDKKHQPTEKEVAKAIGTVFPVWKKLAQFIRENYPVLEDFKYLYGKKYGWALRFRIKRKLLTSLYPAQKHFVVQVILSPDAIEKAKLMKLSKKVHQVIEKAHPYPEGRWLFVPVESETDIRDIKQLLSLRSKRQDK